MDVLIKPHAFSYYAAMKRSYQKIFFITAIHIRTMQMCRRLIGWLNSQKHLMNEGTHADAGRILHDQSCVWNSGSKKKAHRFSSVSLLSRWGREMNLIPKRFYFQYVRLDKRVGAPKLTPGLLTKITIKCIILQLNGYDFNLRKSILLITENYI